MTGTMVSRAGAITPAAAALAGLLACVLLAGGCGRAGNSLLLIEKLPEVGSITFEGNDRFDDGTLKALMTLREGSWWNPFKDHKYRKGQLKSDLNAVITFYMRHGYLRIQILDQQVRTSGDDVHILVRISEGEPVFTQEVVIRGARILNPNRLREKLSLRPDKPFDPFRLQDDRRLILRTLAEQGHWQATVRADVQFFGDRALVFYVLDEGEPVSVRDVTVTGTKEVNPSLVRRDISVTEGEPLHLDDLTKSQVRLLQSGLFADAQWDTAGLDTLKDEIGVRYRVRERKLHWYETGVGVSSQQLIRLTAGWGARNFLGTGMRFALNNRTDLDPTDRVPTLLDETRTEAILNRSHLLGTQWEGQPSVFFVHDRGALQDTVGMSVLYRQSTLGLALSIRRRFGDLRNQIVFTLENRWVNNDADPRVGAIDPQFFRDTYQTRLLSGWVERDSRNAFFSPTRGSYQTALVQLAGGALGGNNAFLKQTAGTINFLKMPVTAWTLAARLRVGYIIPSSSDSTVSGEPIDSRVELIPTEDRYLLGGANTVRGYDQDELDGVTGGTNGPEGGLASILAGVEARFPLFWRLSGVFFLDAGNVWQDRRFLTLERLVPHQDRTEVTPYDLRYSYGMGIRFNTALGPIRIDYARKWNRPEDYRGGKDAWHVALGHAF